MVFFRGITIALIALTCGCGAVPAAYPTAGPRPKLEEVVIPFAFLGNAIAPADAARVHARLAEFVPRPADSLVVSLPPSNLPGGTVARRRALAELLSPHPAQLQFVEGGAAQSQGIIRLVRITGVQATCRPPAPGCATASNLAAMIAKPTDLFLPERSQRYRPDRPASSSSPSAGTMP